MTDPQTYNDWQAVIGKGRPNNTFRFALAETLLTLVANDFRFVGQENLTIIYADKICRHVAEFPIQSNGAGSSPAFEACAQYNKGEIDYDTMYDIVLKEGFKSVFDRFHVVNGQPVKTKFFTVTKRKGFFCLDISWELRTMTNTYGLKNLLNQVERRWVQVEAKWNS